nr:F-box/kelch-repeat protein At3g61590 [Ipomoea batatas]
MDGESSWVSHRLNGTARDKAVCDSFSKLNNEDNKEVVQVPVNLLPDELLERILACLPIASVFRAGCVCKRWNETVSSLRFLQSSSQFPSGKPWYFMFTSSDEPVGYAYDPILRKWHSIELPCIEASNWFIASSCGLVCFMDSDSRSQLYVCNPITKSHRRIEELQDLKYSDYSALGISVERRLCSVNVNYCVSVVKSKQVPGNFFQWDVSIHIYDSETMTWETPTSETLSGWRAGNDSVICDGVLYFLVHSTGGDRPDYRHGLITYSLSSRPTHGSLMRSFIPVPGSLTCGRLMNHKESLIMVGGIAKRDRPDIIKGIGIWALKGREWQEIARMPHKFFQGFGELDDVFASSGTDNLVYIQSYGAPALLIFDVEQKQWRWSNKCPVTKRFPLQLFTGFCFEPRLEITP